jgi:integrase
MLLYVFGWAEAHSCSHPTHGVDKFAFPSSVTSPSCLPLCLPASRVRQGLMTWVRAHTPVNTTGTYATYARQYLAFAEKHALCPEEAVTVAAFLHGCIDRPKPLARSTVTQVIPAAIADLFRYDPDVNPTMDPLVKAVKKVCVRLTLPSQPKLPITKAMLVAMARKATLAEAHLRDVFMFILMFLGFLRESELTSLEFGDVWVGSLKGVVEEVLYIRVRTSKTDPGRNGATVVLAAHPGSPICPVRWFRLFCTVRRSPTHVFHSTEPKALKLAKTTPNSLLKKWLLVIGVDPKPYGSHSLRRGGCSAAAAREVRLHIMKRHGRWASDAVYLYIQDPGESRVAVSRAILGDA